MVDSITMELMGKIDVFTGTEISGWVADKSDPQRQLWVDVNVNSILVASLKAALMRDDLLRAGIGDGRKSFWFDPSRYLEAGDNLVAVRFGGTHMIVPGGDGTLVRGDAHIHRWPDDASFVRLLRISQERWMASEPDSGLTWGQVFTGDSFINAVLIRYTFHPEHHICEIGPGYGRLLMTILRRQLPFRSYTGIELSADRVQKLNSKFANERIQFIQGDANQVCLQQAADIVICSSTCEHLFPDFTRALSNLVTQLKPKGKVAVDFIQIDPEMMHRQQGFEPEGHAFVRVYSAQEIRTMFAECGLSQVELSPIVLGKAASGDVKRIFASAVYTSAGPFGNVKK